MEFHSHKKEKGLFDYQSHEEMLAEQGCALDKLNQKINWEAFRPELIKLLNYKFDKVKGGRPALDPVFMFKIIFLQKYYGLSEENTEFQIKDRFSFMRFLDLSPSCTFPDKNTFWTFKERLGEEGIKSLFELFNTFLNEKGMIGKEGKMVDASFVDIPKPRNSREINNQIKSGEKPKEWKDKPNMKRQKDTDARWTKKNEETHVGYKNHTKVDQSSKFIEAYTVTAANVHDSQEMPNLTKPSDGTMWADSAYVGPVIEKDLEAKGIVNKIHERGARNNPLNDVQKANNKIKSKTRARVEHVFGWQTQRFAEYIRTIGIKRAKFGIGLGNLMYNISRYALLAK